jgi:hypothetical protein
MLRCVAALGESALLFFDIDIEPKSVSETGSSVRRSQSAKVLEAFGGGYLPIRSNEAIVYHKLARHIGSGDIPSNDVYRLARGDLWQIEECVLGI